MLTLLFCICMIGIFGKLFLFGIKAAWGISKMLISILFLPFILIVMVLGGLIQIAFPILLIIGILSLLTENR